VTLIILFQRDHKTRLTVI